MKFCTKCGTQTADDTTFCSHCGHKFETAEQTVNETPKTEETPFGTTQSGTYTSNFGYNAPITPQNAEVKGASAALVCGLIALITTVIDPFAFRITKFILSIVAIVKANKAKKENGGVMPQKAGAGKACAIVSMVFRAITLVIIIIALVGVLGGVISGVATAIKDVNDEHDYWMDVLDEQYKSGIIDKEEYESSKQYLDDSLSEAIKDILEHYEDYEGYESYQEKKDEVVTIDEDWLAERVLEEIFD